MTSLVSATNKTNSRKSSHVGSASIIVKFLEIV